MSTLIKILVALILSTQVLIAQKNDKETEKQKAQELALKKANNHVYEANELINEDDFTSAEMEYRKAISEKPTHIAGAYNLGNSYYNKGNYNEALYRHQQAAKNATDKLDKHKAFHNLGNVFMQNKQCKEAVEAFKNALRNNPKDNETRYNLGLAKECAEQQGGGEDENEDDKKEDEKEDKKDEGEDKEDKKDEGDKDKKEGEDEEDENGKPKDDKKEEGKGDQKKEDQKQQQPGQLSPQQVKNLLEAMNDQEKKVQEKINAEKQKGVKIQTEKDW